MARDPSHPGAGVWETRPLVRNAWVLALVLLALPACRSKTPVEQVTAALGGRPAKVRLPWDPAAPVGTARGELDGLLGDLLAAKLEGKPGAREALVSLYLGRGEAGDLDRALREVEALPEGSARKVALGAVLVAQGRAEEAFEALHGVDGSAAAFDRALAVEALGLRARAVVAWEAFLGLEPEGVFAAEARAAREEAARPRKPVAEPLDRQKRKAVDAILASKTLAEAEAQAEVAKRLAEAGDHLLERELAFLRALPAEGWGARGKVIARYLAARDEVFAGKRADAVLDELAREAEPLISVKAIHVAAYAALVGGRRDDAIARLAALKARCAELGCNEELALVESDLGNVHFQASDFQRAERAYSLAAQVLPTSYRVRHAELLRKQAALAQQLEALDEATERLTRAARLFDQADATDQLGATRVTQAALARERRRYRLAREYLLQGLTELPDNYVLEREALEQDLARAEALAGDVDGALRRIRTVVETLPPEASGHRAGLAHYRHAEVALAAGFVDEARTAVTRSAALYGAGSPWLGPTLALAGDVEVAAGRTEDALRHFRASIVSDERRAAQAPGQLSSARILAEASAPRVAVAHLVASLDPTAAWNAIVGSRPPVDESCRVTFTVRKGELLVLSVFQGITSADRRLIDESALAAAIESLERDRANALASLAPLVGSAAGPGRCPPEAKRIVFHRVHGTVPAPLPELEQLASDREVGVSLGSSAEWPGEVAATTALAIASPLVTIRNVDAIPSANEEIAAVRRFVPAATALEGTSATPEAIRRAAKDADLLHFAVHGEARARRGASSHLLLAGEAGRLQVSDILELSLGRRPVVVLTACNTGGFSADLEHDGAGLPWAFLAAGARAVVATSERVEDRAAAAFSVALYESLAAGDSLPDAVEAGREAVRSDFGPHAASAFVLFF